jgi:hypothetical protein
MDDMGLSAFLFRANERGYSNPDEKTWVAEPDGSTTIHFEDGPWRMHDNFFGGEPYGGREVVFYKGKPAWIMAYYGAVDESEAPSSVYAMLKESLARMPRAHPFRGPRRYKAVDRTYENKWVGDATCFAGTERILRGDEPVYEGHYAGGYVDLRRG